MLGRVGARTPGRQTYLVARPRPDRVHPDPVAVNEAEQVLADVAQVRDGVRQTIPDEGAAQVAASPQEDEPPSSRLRKNSTFEAGVR
jgi:hypothetical protein